VHIIGHWNYKPGTTKNVYVVSSAERVELFLNGKSLGVGEQFNRFLFTFKNVNWQPGVIKALGFIAEKKVAEAEKRTAGPAVALRLMAEWRGGIAQGPDNYILSKALPVENGINRVIIRSTSRAGKIVVRASAEGLKSAFVEIDSRPSLVKDGLSQVSSEPAYLDRGPTPSGESFVVNRRSVKVMRAESGSNVERASSSFDDNETTDWESDGQLTNGWIKYDFDRPATISEVVLKLKGWRTQSYPIRISVDEKVVFEGNSQRSLGYVTFTFAPVVGRSLKIELTGNASNRDAFGNIVEIPGTPDAQSAAGRGGARETLCIIEVEIYGPVGSPK
jgi:hypothetical protein